jgi:hypothetical protein
MLSHANRIAVILTLTFLCACSPPPADTSSNSDSQKLPFDREPQLTGISPSRSVIPSTTKLPEGTPIPIRLQSELSSASSHAGDTFSATVDSAVVVDGQTLISRGTAATGRVLEAKPSASSRGSSSGTSSEPGYLRIVLVNLNFGGRLVTIETSSIFAKGGSREERNGPTSAASSGNPKEVNEKDKDIVFGADRRLNFRLAQTIDLQ